MIRFLSRCAAYTGKPTLHIVTLIVSTLLLCSAPALAAKAQKRPAKKTIPAPVILYAERTEAMQLANEIATRNQLDPNWVRQIISQAQMLPTVAKAVLPPPRSVPKNWAAYRSRFIDAKRIRAGVAFYQNHQTTLERAEREMGVPVAMLLGILGVETIYGQHMGQFRILDALATLAFDFPAAHPKATQRSAFFRSELEAFLKLTQETDIDPLTVRGSYAGAMGLPQFMPSSWRKYAIDFDGDGKVDLFNSPADAIGSVAHYLKSFRWRSNQATHYDVHLSNQADMPTLLAPDIVPTFTAEQFQQMGAVLDENGQKHPGLLALVELKNGDAEPTFVAGTENFYVITRYNWSSYYAMAVIELGQEVAKAWTAQSIMAK